MTTQAELTAAIEKAKEREAANTLYNRLYSQENMLPQADPVGFVAPPSSTATVWSPKIDHH